jgi:predicted ferric reductase
VDSDEPESPMLVNTEEKGKQFFTFYIKAVGRETKALYHIETMKARISRPLGRPYITNAGSEFGDYERIVLIVEGMGITPWISVLHYIREKQHAIKTRSVDLIWSIHSIGKLIFCFTNWSSILMLQ